MAEVRGLGLCMIPAANGNPCGKQIQEGEAIGTIINAQRAPVVGHKRCADAYGIRQLKEMGTPVKIGKQDGPGGSVSDFEDALVGSIPLEKPVSSLDEVAMPPGVRSLAELPFEEPDIQPDVSAALPPRGASKQKAPEQPRRVQLGGTREDRLRQAREALAAVEAEGDYEPVYHDIHLDMSKVPRETEVIRLLLDLRNITE